MLGAGAVGLFLLADAGDDLRLVIAVAVAFAAGWGWNGLYNLAVVRHNENAPAAASGITQAGIYLGGVFGPLVFGLAAETWSYALAWRGAGVVTLCSCLLHLAAARRLRVGAGVG